MSTETETVYRDRPLSLGPLCQEQSPSVRFGHASWRRSLGCGCGMPSRGPRPQSGWGVGCAVTKEIRENGTLSSLAGKDVGPGILSFYYL